MDRKILIIKRWGDILLLTIVSVFITAYIRGPIIDKISAWIENVGMEWSSVFSLLLYSIIPVGLFCCLKKNGGFRWKDFNLIRSWSNPPTWYAAVLVVIFFPICTHLFDSGTVEYDLLWYNVIFWGAIFMLFTAIYWPYKKYVNIPKNNGIHKTNDNLELMSTNPEKLIKWLKKEEPIKSPKEDIFDAITIANRIAKHLLNDPPENISFIGNYGSGKTSVLNLVGDILKQNHTMVLPISTWAFEDGKFVNYILRHIIQEVSQETDCISVALLPLKFQNTFQQLDLGIFSFIKLFLELETPEELVNKVDDILVRSKNKIAIFIEDVDRNTSPEFAGEIYSLFNYFSGTKNISFVITHGGIL